MDLLRMIHTGEISLEKAYDIFDENQARFHRGEAVPAAWAQTFEMSKYEATAYAHGASLADLVKLRYEGWPTICSRCGRPIDYKKFGWWFVHSDDGVPRLRHIECPKTAKSQRRKALAKGKSKRIPSKTIVRRGKKAAK